MIKYIENEECFTAINGTVMLSPSNEECYLEYSADGVNFSQWPDKIPAGEPLMIIANQLNHAIFRLSGNQTRIRLKM